MIFAQALPAFRFAPNLEPIARVTTMQGGQLLERYYYVNSDRTKLIMATLEHGVVVSAEAIPR